MRAGREADNERKAVGAGRGRDIMGGSEWGLAGRQITGRRGWGLTGRQRMGGRKVTEEDLRRQGVVMGFGSRINFA